MPVLSTVGAASLRAFGAFRRGTAAGNLITATGGTVYVDPTNADYKIHQFTSNGTFTITNAPVNPSVEVMMVGGGGRGQYGGGGAGGYIYRPSFSVSVGSFNVVIGNGSQTYANGGDTTFGGLIALGGGSAYGYSGGSGGGGVDNDGGAGLQPTSSSGGYGNKGGDWQAFSYDGGGGGAGGAGGVPEGGAGRTADIISSSGTYAVFAQGGYGSANYTSYALPAAVANSGNGGWGGGYSDISSAPGQAGIVRIRYKFQ